MITGFNTDIEFEGKTFHVQTEDKGLERPIILSLVYDRGTILASKRLPYDDLLTGELDEKVLADRLSKQHRLICAAVRAGRIDELKEMTAKASSKKASREVAVAGAVSVSDFDISSIDAEFVDEFEDSSDSIDPIPKPNFDEDLKSAAPSAEPMVEAFVIEDAIVLPDEAVEIVSEMVGKERPANTKLGIEFLGDAKFRGGERKTVSFMLCRGSDRKVVPDAQIMVKILGSSFRPLIFHATTDSNGMAKVNLQLPNFTEGRAAFLVRAVSNGEEVELRRPIAHG